MNIHIRYYVGCGARCQVGKLLPWRKLNSGKAARWIKWVELGFVSQIVLITLSAHSLTHNAAADLFVLAYLFLSQAKPNTMIHHPPPPSSSPHVYAFWSQALSVITLIVTNPPDPVFWRPLGGSSNTSKSSCPFCGLCRCKKALKRLEGKILKGQRYHLRRH